MGNATCFKRSFKEGGGGGVFWGCEGGGEDGLGEGGVVAPSIKELEDDLRIIVPDIDALRRRMLRDGRRFSVVVAGLLKLSLRREAGGGGDMEALAFEGPSILWRRIGNLLFPSFSAPRHLFNR